METASIVVDLHHMRCGNCKVAFKNEFATHCPTCLAVFTHVVSNHVGLAEKLQRKRNQAGIAIAWQRADEPALVE
jgi:hypothetical protein